MKILPFLSFILAFPSVVLAQEPASEPVGYYSEGSLRNGVRLPDEGPGYMHLFLHRNRGFGSREIIDMIINTAAWMDKKYPATDRLQVGDISQENGGPITDLHGSHMNGLDVDLTYFRKNYIEQNPSHINGFAESMVARNRLSKNFDTARNWDFIKKLHENGRVQRIFMDPVIKKELCRQALVLNETQTHTEVLRSMRPYPGHADHMHVRLRCPLEAKDCRSQEEVDPGTGCAR